ncbi:MAG TPA: hypothetical protein VH062_20595 [Polyangiaceae bacterium]|jgi:hypothetical protein|nr:hypothetical protein [Polyangiaceae bacterium]
MKRAARLLPLAAVLAARVAHAGDPAGAEALFREGRERLTAHDVDAACVKFSESERLDAMPGTLLNLAACHETQGRVATAWAEFVSASELATARGDTAQSDEARRRASTLLSRLPHLTIVMAVSVPGAVVRRDDVVLATGSLGASLPVDPGPHRIVVEAPGYVPGTVEVSVEEGESRELRLPSLVKAPSVAPHAGVTVHGDADARDRRLGWVIGGAGLALGATAGTLYAVAVSANQTAERGCGYQSTYACSAPAIAAGRERDTLSTIAAVTGSVGIAGVAVGLWFLLHPSASEPSAKSQGGFALPAVLPSVTSQGASLYLRESFE